MRTFRRYSNPMKTRLLSLILSCLFLNASAQISVNQNDMPSPGDSVRVSFASGVGSIIYSLSGANYIWDFSSLVANAQQEYRFNSPTALPFNFLSTLAFLNPSPDSLPVIGNIPSNFTDYFKNGSSGYRQNGLSFEYTPLTTFTIPVLYTSSDYVYRFPLNFGDADTSDGAYAINFPPLPYIGQTIHRESTVDGWGTIITPLDTFSVLRMISYVQKTDTISLDSVTGFIIPRPLEVQYKWIANGQKIPVLEIDCQVIASNEVITNVIYQDNYDSTLFQVNVTEILPSLSNATIYPNPTAENCYLNFSSNSLVQVNVSLFDISGREVRVFGKQIAFSGNNSRVLDLNGISDGVYLIYIDSEIGKVTQKIIVKH